MSEHHSGHTPRPPLPSWATRVRPGYFDPRVVHHEFWIDGQANAHHLDDLETEHLHAIARMLTDRSPALYGIELIDTFLRVVVARAKGGVAGEQLAHDLGQPTIADLDAVEWLETTTLLRAIRRTIRTRS